MRVSSTPFPFLDPVISSTRNLVRTLESFPSWSWVRSSTASAVEENRWIALSLRLDEEGGRRKNERGSQYMYISRKKVEVELKRREGRKLVQPSSFLFLPFPCLPTSSSARVM